MPLVISRSSARGRACAFIQVEDFLADFLDDSFATYAEDDSPAQVCVYCAPHDRATAMRSAVKRFSGLFLPLSPTAVRFASRRLVLSGDGEVMMRAVLAFFPPPKCRGALDRLAAPIPNGWIYCVVWGCATCPEIPPFCTIN